MVGHTPACAHHHNLLNLLTLDLLVDKIEYVKNIKASTILYSRVSKILFMILHILKSTFSFLFGTSGEVDSCNEFLIQHVEH